MMSAIEITYPREWYENIFTSYELTNDNNDTYMFHNISSKVSLPADIDQNVFEYWVVPGRLPFTSLSYRIYGDMHLWWLIMLANNIRNPVKLLAPGSSIRVIKQEYVGTILDNLRKQK